MTPRNVMRTRGSILKAGRTLCTKPRDPFEHRLGGDAELLSHCCGSPTIHYSGNDKSAAVRAGLSIRVQLHAVPFGEARPAQASRERGTCGEQSPQIFYVSKRDLHVPFVASCPRRLSGTNEE